MTAEQLEESVLRLSPKELAKFRVWFAEFEAGMAPPPESGATQIGRLAGRAFAGLRKRVRETKSEP